MRRPRTVSLRYILDWRPLFRMIFGDTDVPTTQITMKPTNNKNPWLFAIVGMMISLLWPPEQNLLRHSPRDIQALRIAPMVGYMFGGKLRGYNGELKLSDEFSYGVRLSKALNYGTAIEFSWSSMQSEATLRNYYGSNTERFDMGVNYFLIGATQAWEGSDQVQPFGLLGIGASVFSAKENEEIASGG